MIFSEFGLLGLNSIFRSKKAPFFSIVLNWGRSLSLQKAMMLFFKIVWITKPHIKC